MPRDLKVGKAVLKARNRQVVYGFRGIVTAPDVIVATSHRLKSFPLLPTRKGKSVVMNPSARLAFVCDLRYPPNARYSRNYIARSS